jgi:hypothetical protein
VLRWQTLVTASWVLQAGRYNIHAAMQSDVDMTIVGEQSVVPLENQAGPPMQILSIRVGGVRETPRLYGWPTCALHAR